MYILLAILIFGFLIFIHELGHFIAARICGVHVLEFAIGMGPKLVSIKSKKSGTAYSLRLFPLGGFVSMLGENGMEAVQGANEESAESSILINTLEDPDQLSDDEPSSEEASKTSDVTPLEPDPRAYSSQSVWKRIFISLAGPFMNVFLGFLLMLVFVITSAAGGPLGSNRVAAFFVTYQAEVEHDGLLPGDYLSKIDGERLQSFSQLCKLVTEDEDGLFTVEVSRVVTSGEKQTVENVILTDVSLDPAFLGASFGYSLSEKAGLKVEDTIVKVNSAPVHTHNELAYEIMNQGFEPLDLTVIRDGETIILENIVFPSFEDSGVVFGDVDFRVWAEDVEEGKTLPSLSVILKHAWFRSVSTVKMVYDSLGGLFSGRYGVEAVSGPVGITQTISDVAKTGMLNVVYLVIVISINLGIMNLLPIPGLDGGHLLIYVIEVVRGKPMKKELESTITFIGLLIMLALAVLIAIKDIINL